MADLKGPFIFAVVLLAIVVMVIVVVTSAGPRCSINGMPVRH